MAKSTMEIKQIDLSCPCCNTRLTIDVLTRTVLKHAPPEQVDDTGKPVLDEGRWDAANEKVSSRQDSALDKFDAALGKERSRESDLDDLFEQAKRKAKDDRTEEKDG
jgi:hypothetical protein